MLTAARATLVACSLVPCAVLNAQAPVVPLPRGGAPYYAKHKQADQLFARGERQRAAELFDELARENPWDPELALRGAECRAALGQLEAAIGLLERGYREGADAHYELAYRLAQLCTRANHLDAAIEWLERALLDRYVHRGAIAQDAAFARLSSDARFQKLAGLLPTGTFDRVSGWRYDLDWYEAEVKRMHVGPGRPGQSPEFHKALEALRGRVAGLSDTQVAMELQRITMRLGDGHSVVYPQSTPRVRFATLPLHFYFFNDGLFVIDASGEARDLAGTQVIAIGPKPVAEVVALLEGIVSRDNPMGTYWLGPRFLANATALQALGLTDRDDHVELTVRGLDGSERRVTVAASAPNEPHGADRLGPPPGANTGDVVLWLRRAQEPFWFERIADAGALYVQVNQIGDAPGKTLAAFAAEVKHALEDDADCESMILDLRHNGGGNNFLIWPLVRLLTWFEETSADHRTFVISGRNTFSAAQNCLNQICRVTHAVLAGEPSSSKPNFTGESTQSVLPWSGLTVSISSRWWQDSFPEDERAWIAPQIPVTLSSADYFANRDPVMAAVLEVIESGS